MTPADDDAVQVGPRFPVPVPVAKVPGEAGGKSHPRAAPAPGSGPSLPLPPARVSGIPEEWEILSELGSGGMAVVYKARHLLTDELVALKCILTPKAAEPAYSKRFAREVKLLRRLVHPRLVRLLNSGIHDGRPWLALELVEGMTLRALTSGRRLSLPEIVALGVQITEALEYIHKMDVVHRDLKPENVLLDEWRNAKVTDFGLALLKRRETGQSRLTLAGSVMGTIHYMAPEQLRDATLAGPRSDLYALGVILFEMLTGRLPRAAESPSNWSPGLPPRLEELVTRLLALEPENRPKSATDVLTVLRSVSVPDDSRSGSAVPVAAPRVEETAPRVSRVLLAARRNPRSRWQRLWALRYTAGTLAALIGVAVLVATLVGGRHDTLLESDQALRPRDLESAVTSTFELMQFAWSTREAEAFDPDRALARHLARAKSDHGELSWRDDERWSEDNRVRVRLLDRSGQVVGKDSSSQQGWVIDYGLGADSDRSAGPYDVASTFTDLGTVKFVAGKYEFTTVHKGAPVCERDLLRGLLDKWRPAIDTSLPPLELGRKLWAKLRTDCLLDAREIDSDECTAKATFKLANSPSSFHVRVVFPNLCHKRESRPPNERHALLDKAGRWRLRFDDGRLLADRLVSDDSGGPEAMATYVLFDSAGPVSAATATPVATQVASTAQPFPAIKTVLDRAAMACVVLEIVSGRLKSTLKLVEGETRPAEFRIVKAADDGLILGVDAAGAFRLYGSAAVSGDDAEYPGEWGQFRFKPRLAPGSDEWAVQVKRIWDSVRIGPAKLR